MVFFPPCLNQFAHAPVLRGILNTSFFLFLWQAEVSNTNTSARLGSALFVVSGHLAVTSNKAMANIIISISINCEGKYADSLLRGPNVIRC